MDLLAPLLVHPAASSFTWMDPNWLLDRFGEQMFWISAAIVFVECGLLFPLLPGDSLLFSIGLFINRANAGESGIHMNILVACAVLSAAAFLGNVVGYEIGRAVGPGLFERNGRFLNPRNLEKTHDFFERYGARALVLGRFVPIVRTFITLVAGAGRMDRRHFLTWSLVGAVLWATGLTLLGFAVGGNAFIRDNLEVALLAIVAFSLIPPAVEWWRHRRKAATSA